MTASLVPRFPSSKPARPRQFSPAAGVLVMEGCIVGRYATGANAGCIAEIGTDPLLVIEGVARHTVDNRGSASPGPEIHVDDDMIIPLFGSGLDGSMEGALVYGIDNQTIALSSGGGIYPPIGELWEVINASSAWVRVGRRAVANANAAAGAAELVPGAALTDANLTLVRIGRRSWRSLPTGTLTANRSQTLGTAGAIAGDTFTVTRLDVSAFTYALANGGPAGGTLMTMPASKANFLEAYFNGTDWVPLRLGTQ